MTANAPPNPPAPSPLAGLAVAAVVVTGIFGWVALAGRFLSEASLFAGFMMLWYWAKVEHLAMRRLPSAVLGGLVGVGLAWVIHYGSLTYGPGGFGFGLALLVVAIYLDVIEIVPMLVNASTMLYSIVAAAPLIQLKIDWLELCFATVGGGLFFGAYVAAIMWLVAKLPQKPARPGKP